MKVKDSGRTSAAPAARWVLCHPHGRASQRGPRSAGYKAASADGGGRWMVEETGFGPAVTEWLTLVRGTAGRKRLFAFTRGRGVWRVDLR